MYRAFQAQTDLLWPLRTWAKRSIPMLDGPTWGAALRRATRPMAAACKVLTLAQVSRMRPSWRIDGIVVHGETSPVTEEVVATTPFATLLRFRKEGVTGQPKVLVVAPMSGHFATLLRDTVRTTLQDHDVYVTDWHNVRDVPLEAGRFGLDEYTQHVIDFLEAMGPNANVIAVCQPCVAALAAVALMSEDRHAATPASLTLMAGPIDCRINPTEVNKLATSQPIEWFASKLISTVLARHGGGGRRLYPGFPQLSAFIGMNRKRHVEAFGAYYRDCLADEIENVEKAAVTRTFYEEYMAVADRRCYSSTRYRGANSSSRAAPSTPPPSARRRC